MLFECPSCHLHWEDSIEPINFVSTPLCELCSTSPNLDQLIDWQMDNLKSIDEKHLPSILRTFYKLFKSTIIQWEDKLYDQNNKNSWEDCPRPPEKR